jgi:hypothetical protein
VGAESRHSDDRPLDRFVASGLALLGDALAAVDPRLPAEVWGLGREAAGCAAYAVGAVADADYVRLLGLRGAAELALRFGMLDRAARLARELLSLAERFRDDFYYGNAVHHGHLILGRVALGRGDRAAAGEELLAAGRTPGSPQLGSFGPNMRLARDLLRAGERDVVLRYFELCAVFWVSPGASVALAGWADQVRSGSVPDFKANLSC